MNTNVLRAVFVRNFVSYFANPTGYVFICVFVLLSGAFAFWPDEFFNANLANLDQLNKMFPYIMLIFIPAITMSIWAEERREGTDELLLTVPANDFDIVLGKYLAAVAIFSVSLLFSLVCNFAVLKTLGDPDVGLILGTYVGYWLIGLAMLAVGMIASFLTSNLTVAYILGAVFNAIPVFAPLILAIAAANLGRPRLAVLLKQFGIGQQFLDFGRGVVSFAGVAYFLLIVLVMSYVSMVFIGRRHWGGGKTAAGMGLHYAVRTFALCVIALATVLFARQHELRYDMTSEKLTSLSPKTVELLTNLPTDRPVRIEAFVSPDVPESYIQTKLNLLNTLRELQALGGQKVRLEIHPTEQFTEDASRAEQRFKITPREVITTRRGAISVDKIFLGVAFRCGLNSVTLPFIDRGIPVEYELVRSICTVTEQKRKKIGILTTDAPLFGRFNMQTMTPAQNWPVVDELEKQYEVAQVDAASPITDKYDVLLAVQPSSLGPEQIDNFVASVRGGQATAIFEDPFPYLAPSVPGTGAPRRPPTGNPMMMRQPPPPKGDINRLWQLLGVDFPAKQIIWQDYNPYPKATFFTTDKEFVFVGPETGNEEAFNPDQAISSGLQQVLFPFPGAVSKLHTSKLDFTNLAETGNQTGTVPYDQMLEMTFFGPGRLNPNRPRLPTNDTYVMAARIQGKVNPPPDEKDKPSDNGDDSSKDDEKKAEKPRPRKIDAVVVSDIDMLAPGFFQIRQRGRIPEVGIFFDFDNVTFLLNILDELAGDDRFIDIRKRRRIHRTLTRIDQRTEEARKETAKTRERLSKEYDKAKEEEQEKLNEQVKKIEEGLKTQEIDMQEVLRRLDIFRRNAQKRMDARVERAGQQRDREINRIETELAMEIRRVQDTYKMWAVTLPPIPPLIVAIIVFITRRLREREGVARSRLR